VVTDEWKPLVLLDAGGTVRDLRRTNGKGYRKSMENGRIWELDPGTGRLLPYREDLPLVRITEQRDWYAAVLEYPHPAEGVVPHITAGGKAGTAPDTAAGEMPAVSAGAASAVTNVQGGANAGTDKIRAEETLSRLWNVVENRRMNPPEGSYTSYLFAQGEEKIRKKTGEEAVELILARTDDEIVHEAADLIYHLFVFLSARGIGFDRILGELDRRSES